MRPILAAYQVSNQEVADVQQAVSTLGTAHSTALRQIARTLDSLMDGPYPAQQSQSRFDALVIQLGQRVRELFPNLTDDDDEAAWKRLAVAYAFTLREETDESAIGHD